MAQILTVAVCICNGVTYTDFIPPMEILSSVNVPATETLALLGDVMKNVPYKFAIDYVAPTKEPVGGTVSTLPKLNPTQTYSEALSKGIQYDIIWIPAGPLAPDPVTGKNPTPEEQIDFIRKQGPGAKYIMSVCAGSLQLAMAGLLDGKRATTNKALYKVIVNETSKAINWVPKARWVIDGNVWTSSGVAAGSDMALAFLEHLFGRELAQFVRGVFEIPEVNNSEDDPFAAFHGLV
ncbi:hypothetical protein Clacol_007966 [Clathrus columnatus]|uniref:DJ-1/PfpI domain-containing protein n=1 Tax=Clathrus columnatus TaxID=1419009 RepID=A0AAV5AH85_9AGAM|nr:hypothetical protein Clacol_007966 [Clathrus columnatus]